MPLQTASWRSLRGYMDTLVLVWWNDIARLSGDEVIDLSDLPIASPMSHLYHLYNAEIGHNLKQKFSEGKFASERSNLMQVGNNLWKLQPVK